MSKRRLQDLIWKGINKKMPVFVSMNLLHPVSRLFGFDRGTPVDRYYIDGFLSNNRFLIKGVVMEIADPTYTLKFGSNVEKIEILHNTADNPHATIVGDLTDLNSLPANILDCFICTQTLSFIYDFQKAIIGINHLLKKGGSALVTVGCLGQISRYDADRWGDYWRFTPQGMQKAFEEVFEKNNITVHVYGNVYSACAFLRGLAAEELSRTKLDFCDEDYPVLVTIVARKE